MKNKIIGVLMGGVSREREISLRSGKNVSQALKDLRYKIKEIDITGVDCVQQIKDSGIEVAFNILHGTFGEDGGIQAVLEELKIPYTGSGVTASQVCMDKIACKKVLLENNLPTPDYQEPKTKDEITMSAPLVIKAASEGSSFGVSIVKNDKDTISEYQKIADEYGPEILIEKYVSGKEVTVGMIKDGDSVLPLPILELVPNAEFYDFKAKYTPGGTKFILPANISDALTEKISKTAVAAYTVLNCDGAARIDFLIDTNDEIYIIDVNTVPGMTQTSDLPAEAKEYGISFEQLVEKILLTADIGKK